MSEYDLLLEELLQLL